MLISLLFVCGSILSWCSAGAESDNNIPMIRPLEGFGASAPRMLGRPYEVTNLNDSGPGSLRDAVSEPNRFIYFSVGGTIFLESTIKVTTHHLMIDGTSAPPPGIILSGGTLLFAQVEPNVAHDIILRNIRIQDAYDNLGIGRGAYNIVIDHCSFRRAGDGNIDIYDRVHDVTIQWCILADNIKNSLIRDNVENLSIHHNLYVHGYERNPQIQADCLVMDFVNNVIYDWDNYGSRIRTGSTGNYVKNTFIPGSRSDVYDALMIMEDTSVYTQDNVLPEQSDGEGNRDTRWPAPPVTEMDPQAAVFAVLSEAGAFPRDAVDMGYIGDVWEGMAGTFPLQHGPVAQDLRLDVRQPIVPGSNVVVTYSVGGDTPIRLGVYDISGRRLATLRNGQSGHGRNSVVWDGRTEFGSRLPSGIYFLKLQTDRGAASRKIHLIR